MGEKLRLLTMFVAVVLLLELVLFLPALGATSSDTIIDNTFKTDLTQTQQSSGLKDTSTLFSEIPKTFTENLGQLENDDVRFYDQGGKVWFTDEGVWLEVRDKLSMTSRQSTVDSPDLRLTTDDYRLTTNDYKRVVLKQEFLGANQVQPVGCERAGWNSNFFYGNDSAKWCTDVPNYKEIHYKNIYPGIDVRYGTRDNGFKYDIIVYPNADPTQIRLRYDGATGLELDDTGDMLINTSIDVLKDSDLYIYQDYNGYHRQINGRFVIYDQNEFGYEITGDYDHARELIIDPFLIYSTYVGTSGDDNSYEITVDSNGNAFICGDTDSPNFPTTTGAFDRTHNGTWDGVVFKLNANASDLIYSTYIGGSADEISYDIAGWGMAVDSVGNLVLAGHTNSTDFPITQNANDTSYNGGKNDLFVLKLNATGSGLIYSTFIGGSESDSLWGGLAIDSSGNTVIAGCTNSSDFPTTEGVYDTIYNDLGFGDGFMLKLNSQGSSIIYSTFIGGSEYDFFYGLRLDSANNIYATGCTYSSDFPKTDNAWDKSYGGNLDGFVIKLNPNMSDLIYSTYIGGSDTDNSFGFDIDDEGNAYVTGRTYSNNFPTTSEAYDSSFNGGDHDGFVVKLNPNGSAPVYSTYIGTSDFDQGNDIEVDLYGNAIVLGYTAGIDFPITPTAYDNSYNGDNMDAFVTKFNRDGSNIIYSTYIGGTNTDFIFRITMDSEGYCYITGTPYSTDFPTTPDAYDDRGNGDTDFIVFKCYLDQLSVNSFSLDDKVPPVTVYSQLRAYTFRVNITDTISITDVEIVRLTLDPANTNIHLMWSQATDEFSELYDPHDYITLDTSSKATSDSMNIWVIDFNVTFNWKFPHEEPCDVSLYITTTQLETVWFNKSEMFEVENDLTFLGALVVTNDKDENIQENQIVRGGESLTWTGLTVIYDGTFNVYPAEDSCNVTLWDSESNSWSTSTEPGEDFSLEMELPYESNLAGETYTLNLTSIPAYCDATSYTFVIRIDSDSLVFSEPSPGNTSWQNKHDIKVGITITDLGGGVVDCESVMRTFSIDNVTTWDTWKTVYSQESAVCIKPEDIVTFKDGYDNLVMWQATDNVGNGPIESKRYRVLVDTQNVNFYDRSPGYNFVSSTEDVIVGINVSDNISGVDASSIEYTFNTDNGFTWNDWRSVPSYEDNSIIQIRLNVTLPNGTDNLIKWRAYDIAGNGPTESEIYRININTWLADRLKVALVAPVDNSTITTPSIELSWTPVGIDPMDHNIAYDVYFDTIYPPEKVVSTDLITTKFLVSELVSGETYYWTIRPKVGTVFGSCMSGVWKFRFDTNAIIPEVNLLSPENNSIIWDRSVILEWVPVGLGSNYKYEVYFGKEKLPVTIVSEKSENNNLTITGLEHGKTYYWTVVPISELNVYGTYGKTIRSFKVDFEAFDVALGPVDDLVIEQGGSAEIVVKLTNKGIPLDSYKISLVPGILKQQVLLSSTPEVYLLSEDSTNIIITIKISKDTPVGEYPITVSARSMGAENVDFEIMDNTTFKIQVKSQSAEARGSNEQFWWAISTVILIVIILVLMAFLILSKKRKAKADADPSLGDGEILESEMIKPGITIKPVGNTSPPTRSDTYDKQTSPKIFIDQYQAPIKPGATAPEPKLRSLSPPSPPPGTTLTQPPNLGTTSTMTTKPGLPGKAIVGLPPLLPKAREQTQPKSQTPKPKPGADTKVENENA